LIGGSAFPTRQLQEDEGDSDLLVFKYVKRVAGADLYCNKRPSLFEDSKGHGMD
jgi:hypothetical protein